MSKLHLIDKIREIYARGENVMDFLRDENATNDLEAILISYDFQAGTYTELSTRIGDYVSRYTDAIAEVWREFGSWHSVMEVGVGEATLMLPLLAKIDPEGTHEILGFDISWSRSRYALDNAEKAGRDARIFVANLFEIPLADNSVDIVYTSHSLESNGGREADALVELCRVARRYVVLLEPDYGSVSAQGKARMDRFGYVRDLNQHAHSLGYDVIEDRPFGVSINPLNPTRLTIIRTTKSDPRPTDFICPITRSPLIRHGDVYFGPASGLLFPVIDRLPCLVASSATLGLHFGKFNRG